MLLKISKSHIDKVHFLARHKALEVNWYYEFFD